MKLERGKYYRTGHGDLVGPMRLIDDVWLDQHGGIYHEDGRQWSHHPDSAGNIVTDEPEANRLLA